MITRNNINDLINSANYAGFDIQGNDLQLIQWNAGIETHIPQSLPLNMAAVYIFKWENSYLKVGKVNENSNARYLSQHYNSRSSPSNLAKSILLDLELNNLVDQENIGNWIKENTTRYNILIPTSYGKNFVHFTEAFFILKCCPRYENTRV